MTVEIVPLKDDVLFREREAKVTKIKTNKNSGTMIKAITTELFLVSLKSTQPFLIVAPGRTTPGRIQGNSSTVCANVVPSG